MCGTKNRGTVCNRRVGRAFLEKIGYRDATVEEIAECVLDFVIKVASGEVRTRAEQLGQDDFIPWKRGVSF